MDTQQKQELRQRIEDDIASCKEAIARLEISAAPIAPSNAIGRLTRMDSMNDHGISKAALGQNREKLYKLEQALEGVEKPGFGDCTMCGRAIPAERLVALPESTCCVICASR